MATKNGVSFRQVLVPANKRSIKCPYAMNPKKITLHNTDNQMPAINEINYMNNNNNQTSYHVAVDEKEAIQGVPFNRNAWNSGDGLNGYGNRNTVAIEICRNYDRSRKTTNLNEPLKSQYSKAEQNAIKYVAQLCIDLGIVANNNNIKTHNNWNGKWCPSKILNENRLQSVKNAIIAEYNRLKGNNVKPSTPSKPSTSKPVTPSKPSSGSIVDYLNSQGKDSSFSARKKLANQYGIKNYTGTAKQNTDLLNAMRSGKKEQPKATNNNVSNYKGGSIVDYLNLSGNKHLGGSSFNNRKKLAEANGIRGYTGTAAQNKQLLLKLQGGSVATPTRSVNVNAIAEQIKRGIDSQGRRIPVGHELRRKHFGLTASEYAKVRARVNKIM